MSDTSESLIGIAAILDLQAQELRRIAADMDVPPEPPVPTLPPFKVMYLEAGQSVFIDGRGIIAEPWRYCWHWTLGDGGRSCGFVQAFIADAPGACSIELTLTDAKSGAVVGKTSVDVVIPASTRRTVELPADTDLGVHEFQPNTRYVLTGHAQASREVWLHGQNVILDLAGFTVDLNGFGIHFGNDAKWCRITNGTLTEAGDCHQARGNFCTIDRCIVKPMVAGGYILGNGGGNWLYVYDNLVGQCGQYPIWWDTGEGIIATDNEFTGSALQHGARISGGADGITLDNNGLDDAIRGGSIAFQVCRNAWAHNNRCTKTIGCDPNVLSAANIVLSDNQLTAPAYIEMDHDIDGFAITGNSINRPGDMAIVLNAKKPTAKTPRNGLIADNTGKGKTSYPSEFDGGGNTFTP